MKKLKFTLLEILIVVAIIGILGTMLLGKFAKAREHAFQTACASNLSQIGKTFYVHMKENQNYLPTYNWMANSSVRTNYYCPKDEEPVIMNFYTTSYFHKQNDTTIIADTEMSFGFNLSASSQRGSDIDNPGDFVMMFDSSDLATIDAGSSDSGGGQGNNGHGNNADGVDSSNPGKGGGKVDESGGVDDENNATSDGNPFWTTDIPDAGPNDYDKWYYNNLSFRHLNKANHLMFDGSVLVVSSPLPYSYLIYKQ